MKGAQLHPRVWKEWFGGLTRHNADGVEGVVEEVVDGEVEAACPANLLEED